MFLQRIFKTCTTSYRKRNNNIPNYKINPSKEDIREIENIICHHVGIDNLHKKSRKRDYVIAKGIFIKLCHENGLKCLPIAKIIGLNHATIKHSLDSFESNFIDINYRTTNMESFRELYLKLRPKINKKFIEIINNN